MDAFEPIEKSEERWIEHCEVSLRKGRTPPRWKDLPEWIKTERMREYYIELRERIERQNGSG
ncbi:hypothetical protein Q4554_15440 [Leptospira santarosai]|uniref:hypothetical protein n=1 Tax=Leptospira santarosai TaxID=28183 RepID=UPI0026E287A3|nr:hypothetical protein [Leptospira santarosai]MDO6395471.1 hypothetical protein [Leptospira santarosai]